MRGAILLVIVTLVLAASIMWASLPVKGATLSGRHAVKHRRSPPLPPVRYRPNNSLDAQIGRWLAGQLGAPWR